MEKKAYYKYYKIQSCYTRNNKESGEEEVVVIWNEYKWKSIISSYPQWFVYTPQDFVEKFWSHIKKDEYNKGLTWLIMRSEINFSHDNECIVKELPDDLK